MIEENTIQEVNEGSKNEVFAAYHELLQKLKETKKAPSIVEEKVIEEKKHVVEIAVKETITDDLAIHLKNLKHSLNASLDEIETKLLAEKTKFANLEEAIAIQTKELNDLYEIKPTADTLAALLMAHKERSAALEHDIMQKKRAWKKEQEEFETAYRNQQAQIKKEQLREEEEYNYRRDLLRQKEQDQYEANKRNMENELTIRRLQVEEELRMREAKIVAREYEFDQLKEKIEQFPEEIQRVIAETERNISDKLRIKFEYEAKLMEKDFENERKAHQQAIAAYEAQIDHLKSSNYSFKTLSLNPQNTADKDKLY